MPNSQSRPDSRFLDGVDGFLDARFDWAVNSPDADNCSMEIDPTAQEWAQWNSSATPFGHMIYLKPDLRSSPHRLLLTFADPQQFAWSLGGVTQDGMVVLVMYRNINPPEPVAYVVGRPPWRRYNMNFPGCLRLSLLVLFSWVILILFIGFVATFF